MLTLDDISELDIDSFTIGEYCIVEELTGLDMEDIAYAVQSGEWVDSARLLAACLLVLGKRNDQDYTIEDALSTRLIDLVGE